MFVAGHILHLQGCVLSHLLRGGKGAVAGGFLLQPKYHLITIEDVESSKFEVWSFSCKTCSLSAACSPWAHHLGVACLGKGCIKYHILKANFWWAYHLAGPNVEGLRVSDL